MTRMTMVQALRSAMDVMLGRDDDVVIYGQDVGYFGGVFRCTDGLQAKYGTSRVFDAPISEGGIVGSAIGMAAYGLRPETWVNSASGLWLCVCPPKMPPPQGMRIVIGALKSPADR